MVSVRLTHRREPRLTSRRNPSPCNGRHAPFRAEGAACRHGVARRSVLDDVRAGKTGKGMPLSPTERDGQPVHPDAQGRYLFGPLVQRQDPQYQRHEQRDRRQRSERKLHRSICGDRLGGVIPEARRYVRHAIAEASHVPLQPGNRRNRIADNGRVPSISGILSWFSSPRHMSETFTPSRTAEVMALFRALETLRPPRERLFADPLAEHFLGSWGRALVIVARIPFARRLVERVVDRRWPGARTSAIARTRLIDDAVGLAMHDGAAQLVLLGAGFDSRPYRLAVGRARIFELDQPATQKTKDSGD